MTARDYRHPPGGLRDRNLTRNRAEAAAVALDLFDERGFDAVTIDDIAKEAGISRRTFFRYFESKEGAVLPFEDERLDLLRQALVARSGDEPLLATIQQAARTILADSGVNNRTDALRRMRIVRENPSVHAWSLEVQSRWEAVVRDLVAAHLGVESASSVVAQVIGGAAIAAVRAATEVWLASGGDQDLDDLLGEAYEVLTHGLTVTAEMR
jgi:AcrR family transcriptional regulator